MRKYEDIYKDYCKWLVKNTKNEKYKYETMIETMGKQNADAFCYKSLLELMYDKRDGLYYFCKFIIGDLLELGYPRAFRYNTLLRKWDKLLKTHMKVSLLCARGHGKTVFFSEILNLYDMFLFKFKRIIIISASQEQANHILDEMKAIIKNNEWLDSKRDKDDTRWAIETFHYNGGYVIGRGIGSEILGQHVDRIVIDDILRSDNKLSEVQIEDYIDMTLDPMLLNRDGQMVLVGTPKRDGDIFSTMRKRSADPLSGWHYNAFPAIINMEKKILQCPDRFTWAQLMQKKHDMGALKFAREYQLEFFSREQSLFPESLRQLAIEKGHDKNMLYKLDKRGPNWMIVGGVDVARSGSVSADFTVVTILAVNTINQEKEILYIWRSKGLKITEQGEEISRISRNFENPIFLVEQNNFGQDMIDTLVDDYNINIETFVTGGKGQKKDELIRFLITAFEHEKVIIPWGNEETREVMGELNDELSKFCLMYTAAGNEQYKGVGGHDDMVMSLALANRASQIGGVPFAVIGDASNSPYDAFINKSKESELVELIRLGLIK